MIFFTYKIASNPPSPPFTKAACSSQGGAKGGFAIFIKKCNLKWIRK